MALIALPARLTISEAKATLAQLEQALASSDATPVLDAAPLHELDTSAVAVLLACQRAAQAAGKQLSVQGAPAKLVQLATLYGVEGLIGQPAG